MALKPRENRRSGDHPNPEVDEMTETAAGSPDAETERKVAALLGEDRSLDASSVAVQIRAGTVVLSGTVLTEDERMRAEECARTVVGDGRIENRIEASDPLIERERTS